MKYLKFIIIGMVFGIVLSKAEIISWFRWREMFLFEGFQIFGTIITAVTLGAIGIRLINKYKVKNINNEVVVIPDKKISLYRYAIGGLIFGLGFAMAGCPGATYSLIGNGYLSMIIALLAALAGTFVYGLIRRKLPH